MHYQLVANESVICTVGIHANHSKCDFYAIELADNRAPPHQLIEIIIALFVVCAALGLNYAQHNHISTTSQPLCQHAQGCFAPNPLRWYFFHRPIIILFSYSARLANEILR